MEATQKVEPAKVEKEDKIEAIERLFDDLLTKNYITDTVKVGGMEFVIHPLSTAEFLEAETVYIASVASVPRDVVDRVRLVSTLAYAIVSINGIAISDNSTTGTDERSKVHTMLMKLPPAMIDTLHNKYKELVDTQSKVFENVDDKIENF